MSQLYRTMTGQSQKSQISEQTTLANSPSLSRTTTTDPLTGTANHLTAVQVEKLQEFKRQLEKGGWWTKNGVNGKPSHDDGTLLYVLCDEKPLSNLRLLFSDDICARGSSTSAVRSVNSPTTRNG